MCKVVRQGMPTLTKAPLFALPEPLPRPAPLKGILLHLVLHIILKQHPGPNLRVIGVHASKNLKVTMEVTFDVRASFQKSLLTAERW